MISTQRKLVRVMFDETHSESWSISAARACEMQPEDPENASYERAARALADRDFVVKRNTEQPLAGETLHGVDILVLLHPCDSRWERTTSVRSPMLSAEELESIGTWVHSGGS